VSFSFLSVRYAITSVLLVLLVVGCVHRDPRDANLHEQIVGSWSYGDSADLTFFPNGNFQSETKTDRGTVRTCSPDYRHLRGVFENGSNRRLVVRNWARGGSRVSADRKGRQGIGKPDQAKHTMYRGWPHPRNPRYSGFRGVFRVCCLRLQRLGSSLEFGTGTRMAPNTSFPG
jgi:hypothetical protein